MLVTGTAIDLRHHVIRFLIVFSFALIIPCGPGYLINRTLLSSRAYSLALAPATSISLFVALGLLAYPISFPWHVFVLASYAIAMLSFLTLKRSARATSSFELTTLLSYIAFGLIIASFIYLLNIDGVDSFSVQTDSAFHLSCARAMLETGKYSVLHASWYPADILTGKGYLYPAAWHILVALTSGTTGAPVTVGANAINLAVCGVVLPLSEWALISRVFESNKSMVYAGAPLTVTFVGFPWNFLITGQYDSNLLAFALVPSFVCLAHILFDPQRTKERMYALPLMLVSAFALATSQTNAIFAAGVLSIPLIIRCVWFLAQEGNGRRFSRVKPLLCASGACILIAIAWFIAFRMPFMKSVVEVYRAPMFSSKRALLNIASLSFGAEYAPQPVLGAFTLIGFIAIFARRHEYAWLAVSYLLSASLYFICACTDGPAKQLMCGFWYSGCTRIGGFVSLAAIPLATIGLATALGINSPTDKSVDIRRACSRLVCVLITTAVFAIALGCYGINHGAQYVSVRLNADYDKSGGVAFTSSELAFVQKVKDIVGNDLVINIPSDGSVWLYGSDAINTMAREFYNSPCAEFDLFKQALCDISSNQHVVDAVRSTGARYVLLLDETVHVGAFDEEEWLGILSITDETPGFKAVLNDGDMRLYEITV